MAETRKFDPTDGDNDVQRQVRAALGETIRPTQPGTRPTAEEPEEGVVDLALFAGSEADGQFLFYGSPEPTPETDTTPQR